MGAKDLFKSLFFPKETKKKKVSTKKTHLKIVSKPKQDSKQTDDKSSSMRTKQEIEILKKQISNKLSTPEGSKKAALIIEKMLHKK